MRAIFIAIFIVLAIFGLIILFKQINKKEAENINIKIEPMKIESTAFKNNQFIPARYTCDGDNINPPLTFSNLPEEAKSLALIVDDPDAPGGTWVHWVVFNIDPKIKEIAENSVPINAIEGVTSFDKSGYGGPCPPSGNHRYFFKLYALDTILSLGLDAGKKEVELAMAGHILAQAELIGLYKRK